VINLNTLARDITLKEGMKESMSIAQVKEVLKITMQELGKYKASEIMLAVEKYK
jgi:hypothetical protein